MCVTVGSCGMCATPRSGRLSTAAGSSQRGMARRPGSRAVEPLRLVGEPRGERESAGHGVILHGAWRNPQSSCRVMTPTSKTLTGLALGVATGLFLGEQAEPFRYAADTFVRLLEMTVLPYLTVSLIAGLGSL